MSYGTHRADRAWSQQEDPDDGDINELIDSPPNEDAPLHDYVEGLLGERELEEANPYHGTMYDFDDDAPY